MLPRRFADNLALSGAEGAQQGKGKQMQLEPATALEASEAMDAAFDAVRDAFTANRTAGHRTARLMHGTLDLRSPELLEDQLAEVEADARAAELDAWTALYHALGMARTVEDGR